MPQDSILGSYLFNLYINDVVRIDENSKFVIYADDLTLLFSGPDIPDITGKANETLARLYSWSNNSSLKININKTKTIFFRPKNKALCAAPPLMLDAECIEVVQSIKS